MPNTAPPAFPVNTTGYEADEALEPSRGLSDRDYFAAFALQGLLASGVHREPASVSKRAFQWADATLAARGET